MFEPTLYATGAVILLLALAAYQQTREPLQPMILFAPLLLYVYVYNPLMLNRDGALGQLFGTIKVLDEVVLVNFAGVTAFCLGCCWHAFQQPIATTGRLVNFELSPSTTHRVYNMACILGAMAVGAFVFMVFYSGGFSYVFLRGGKPFLSSPSGYVGELPMLAYPALILLAISLRGRRLRIEHYLLALLIASPHLIMSLLGGRRGPTFLIFCTLAVCWFIVRSKRPTWRQVIAGVCVLGLLLLFLVTNRQSLLFSRDSEIDLQAFQSKLVAPEVSTGDEFVCGSATILASNHYQQHFWGARYICLFLVRPVPKQIWPNKYDDMGMAWIEKSPGSAGFTPGHWQGAVGFEPAGGNAGGFVADVYLEFHWGHVVGCGLLGWLYSLACHKWRLGQGLWTLIYFEMVILSVYLPAQSVGAWLYRLMILALPTLIVWNMLMRRGLPHRPPRTVPLGSRNQT